MAVGERQIEKGGVGKICSDVVEVDVLVLNCVEETWGEI